MIENIQMNSDLVWEAVNVPNQARSQTCLWGDH